MPGPRQEHFQMFARYNRWANQQLYRAAGQLTVEALAQDRGAYFKSVLGTLNHLLVADRVWMGRLDGVNQGVLRLDEILHGELGELREARQQEDQRIIARVFGLEEEQLAASLSYQTSSGAPQTQPLHQVLSHLFNHQTHHRGQAHDLICQLLGPAKTPPLDLLIYQRFAAMDSTV
jgi:uncharacterized damage-inducible protein DinB